MHANNECFLPAHTQTFTRIHAVKCKCLYATHTLGRLVVWVLTVKRLCVTAIEICFGRNLACMQHTIFACYMQLMQQQRVKLNKSTPDGDYKSQMAHARVYRHTDTYICLWKLYMHTCIHIYMQHHTLVGLLVWVKAYEGAFVLATFFLWNFRPPKDWGKSVQQQQQLHKKC